MSKKYYEEWDTSHKDEIFGVKWADFVHDKKDDIDRYIWRDDQDNTINGDGRDEKIKAKGGDDTINADGGNDIVLAGEGNDIVNGGEGDDLIFGDRDSFGSSWHGSGKGSSSGSYDDVINPGGGNDVVFADQGDDTVIFDVGDNEGDYNFFDGGIGEDTLKLNFTSQEWQELNQGDPRVQDELVDFLAFLDAQTAGGTQEAGKVLFQFHSLQLTVMRFEDLQVMVDGVTIDPTNETPTVSASAATPVDEAGNASAQDLSDSGTVSFNDGDMFDLVDITFASNGAPVLSSGNPLNPTLAQALVDGFDTGAIDQAVPGTTPWNYTANDLDLDFLSRTGVKSWSPFGVLIPLGRAFLHLVLLLVCFSFFARN